MPGRFTDCPAREADRGPNSAVRCSRSHAPQSLLPYLSGVPVSGTSAYIKARDQTHDPVAALGRPRRSRFTGRLGQPDPLCASLVQFDLPEPPPPPGRRLLQRGRAPRCGEPSSPARRGAALSPGLSHGSEPPWMPRSLHSSWPRCGARDTHARSTRLRTPPAVHSGKRCRLFAESS